MTTPVLPGEGVPGRRAGTFALVAYAILGLAAYWPVWPGDPSRISQCACGDTALNSWFLAWTPFALLHGHNPFVTGWLNHPAGVDLAANVQMPLLGLLAAPLTLTAGPVASLNLLMWLALPLSAGSMYFVLRRWTGWAPAAFVGGLLYGFSPFVVGQAPAHLHLTFIPLPPLILLAAHELFVRQQGSSRRWGAVLGGAVAAQYFISTEILAMTGTILLLAAIVLAASRPHRVLPSLRAARSGLGWAVGIPAVLTAYPTWLMLAGPQHYASSGAGLLGTYFHADLLGPVVPTSATRVAPGSWFALGDRFIPGDSGEDGSYLGIPLVLVSASIVTVLRRDAWVRLCALMAAVTFVLSLGPRLWVDAHRTAIPLPLALADRLPLLGLMLPSRWSMATAMFVAVLVALGIDRLRARGRTTTGRTATGQWRRTGVLVATTVATAAVVVSLLPRWPEHTVRTSLPPYFSSPSERRIPTGGVVLTYPYPMPGTNQPMLWQATTGMRFRLVGGEGLVPDRAGIGTLDPTVLQPASVQRFFVNEAGGSVFFDSAPVADDRRLVADLQRFLRSYSVGTVLVATGEPHARVIEALVSDALGGARPVQSGGIAAWYGVGVRRRPG